MIIGEMFRKAVSRDCEVDARRIQRAYSAFPELHAGLKFAPIKIPKDAMWYCSCPAFLKGNFIHLKAMCTFEGKACT